jgi:HK97 family phage portal protein
MAIFKKHKEIQQKIDTLQQQIKGFTTGNNIDNEFIKRLFASMNFQMVQWESYTRTNLYNTYRSNSAVFGIIDKIARAVGDISQYIELLDAKNKVIENYWINDILHCPNDRFSMYNFFYSWATNYLVFGDAFVFAKKEVGKNFGNIKEMYIIPGQIVSIETGGWKEPIVGIKLTNDASSEPISKDNYFQSFIYNLDEKSMFGFSPLIAASYDCQLLEKGKRRLNTSLENGGVNTLITPARDKDGFVMPQTAMAVEEELNDVKNANKSKFLRQAVEVHNIGSTPVQLDVLESSKDAVTALCFAYNIPVDLYYGQSKYENAKEAKKALYESAAIPLINVFCTDFVNFIQRDNKKNNGIHLMINTDKIDVLQNSTTDILNNLNLMGASLNEKRNAMGYEPINQPYADEPMLSLGIQFGNSAYDINENA